MTFKSTDVLVYAGQILLIIGIIGNSVVATLAGIGTILAALYFEVRKE
jgi:hypothetical protein